MPGELYELLLKRVVPQKRVAFRGAQLHDLEDGQAFVKHEIRCYNHARAIDSLRAVHQHTRVRLQLPLRQYLYLCTSNARKMRTSRQYLYFCTSNARTMRTASACSSLCFSICTFVLVKQGKGVPRNAVSMKAEAAARCSVSIG